MGSVHCDVFHIARTQLYIFIISNTIQCFNISSNLLGRISKMVLIWFLLSRISSILGDTELYYEDHEDYEEIPLANLSLKAGHRLVGGRLSATDKYQFLVGWNMYGWDATAACTGSLITHNWFLSAAHCNPVLNPLRDGYEKRLKKCVKNSQRGKPYRDRFNKIYCAILPGGDLEVKTTPQGKAFHGVDNVLDSAEIAKGHVVKIKRYIRHKDSYKGGGTYGRFGGYDITLAQLEEPMYLYRPACIPGPRFDDTRQGYDDSIVAGYGKSIRTDRFANKVCETNRFGQMKYHYCDTEYGEGAEACRHDDPPADKECDEFFKAKNTPNEFPSDLEEIHIKTGDKSKYCFHKINPQNITFGWCYTKGNYYNHNHQEPSFKGWGYCGNECYPDIYQQERGQLREKTNAVVLPDKLCDMYLEESMVDDIEVRPQILCVSQMKKWKEQIWTKNGQHYSKSITNEDAERYGRKSYVASIGTCNGDSGGPVFVEEEKGKYVVTGVVSGGRGPLSMCGGIDNPVHYTRVKKFSSWILHKIGEDKRELCWDDDFERKLAKMRDN